MQVAQNIATIVFLQAVWLDISCVVAVAVALGQWANNKLFYYPHFWVARLAKLGRWVSFPLGSIQILVQYTSWVHMFLSHMDGDSRI